MKIVYLTSETDPKTGWGRYSSDLISGIKNKGHQVKVLKSNDDGYLGEPVLDSRKNIFSLASKIQSHLTDCDIIHALDGYPYGVIAALANRKLKKKLIITGVGTYAVAPLYHLKTFLLTKWAYKQANYITAISSYTLSEMKKKSKIKDSSVILPGINSKKFFRQHNESNEEFIISVGALKHRKGYHVSIPAFSKVKKDFPNLKYVIVGNQKDTNYFNLLKKLAKENNVSDDVIFLTNISDEELADKYSKAKLFILTSINHDHHFEGYGLVFLEAAASGLPVIGTQDNGILDAVKDNHNGLLVPQNSIDKTAEALLKLLSDEKLSREFSQNSYDWVEENDTLNSIKAYHKLYEGLV